MDEPADLSTPRCGTCGEQLTAAGAACPRCAIASPPAAPARPAPTLPAGPGRRSRRHPQTLASVLTFCFGLAAITVILAWWSSNPLGLLNHLRVAAMAGTLVYLLLRTDEGDFRALFMVALGIFALQEALVYSSRVYGTLQFQDLASLLAVCSAIFASLGLTAAAYDAQQEPQDRYETMSFLACLIILLLSLLRVVEPWLTHSQVGWLSRVGSQLGLVSLIVLAVGGLALAYGLLKTYGPPSEGNRHT
jgi:hypothetical protein